MIKNVIFDLGNVLLDFNWRRLLERLGYEGETLEHIADATVRDNAWNEFDRSALSDEEILASFIANAPELEKEITNFFEHIGGVVEKYAYADEWVDSLKKKGYGVYILSNYPRRTYMQAREQLDFVDRADGAVFSFEVGMIKPELAIYKFLLDKYKLQANECVFIDDKEENLVPARELGITGIQCISRNQVLEDLSQLGVES